MGSGNLVPILDSSSNQIYDIFLSKKQIPPTAKGILTDKYPDANWNGTKFTIDTSNFVVNKSF